MPVPGSAASADTVQPREAKPVTWLRMNVSERAGNAPATIDNDAVKGSPFVMPQTFPDKMCQSPNWGSDYFEKIGVVNKVVHGRVSHYTDFSIPL